MLSNPHKLFLLIFVSGFLSAQDIMYNASVSSKFGNSYDFYSFSENRIDINLFKNNFQGWIQYEYSNPPDIGFPINDIRKFRIEYQNKSVNVKLGDIYEIWGRGLVLNQFDDQLLNFDNGLRGIFLETNKGPFSITHINGNSSIWSLGLDMRIPYYNDNHNIIANRLLFENGSIAMGFTHLISKEEHSKLNLDIVDVGHTLKGAYMNYSMKNFDVFFEYVDKVSITKNIISNNHANDTLKTGFGLYGNLNFYFGNWGFTTEYKNYSFDSFHSDKTPDDYGNQIQFQQMPTLGREHNSTLLGRLSHNYNFNDERGLQYELNGSIFDFSINLQYAHLSRNELWSSNNGPFFWTDKSLKTKLPSTEINSNPYFENFQEVSGFLLDDKLFFKIGRGANNEVLGTNWFYDGNQSDTSLTLNFEYDTTYSPYAPDYPIITVDSLFDSSIVNYNIEAKNWRTSKSFTLPIELNYTFDNGYSFGIGFQYQERSLNEKRKGNSHSYNVARSKWNLINPNDPSEKSILTTSQLSSNGKSKKIQHNRLLSMTFTKTQKWSLTMTLDWTDAYEIQSYDPYYNPLEAFIYGDLKYFRGKRDKVSPPSFIQNKWISTELSYNISSSQKVSIFYGSIQGGLFCNNGICRIIPPFNDGLKVTYNYSL